MYAVSKGSRYRHDIFNDDSDHAVELVSLSTGQLIAFGKLIENRRPLPAFHGDFWRCQVCVFESTDLDAMVSHIINHHDADPFGDDDLRDNCRDPYLEKLLREI